MRQKPYGRREQAMGIYLNPGSSRFEMAVNSEVFVDKTAMVSYLNSCVNTNKRYVSVSRPRRFGKTMAADMVCSYYGRGDGDARALFGGLKVAKTEPVAARSGEARDWDFFLGAFDVVRVTVTEFLEDGEGLREAIECLVDEVTGELMEAYPDVRFGKRVRLHTVMARIHAHTGRRFVIVIDEWDAPMRERPDDEDGQRVYLDFLRDWLKDQPFVALAYMTGILPIKKYGVHSALNMFDEYSMVAPLQLAEYAGFTEREVRELCAGHGRDFSVLREWYAGYEAGGIVPPGEREAPRFSLYAPLSVAKAVSTGKIANYWGGTETYEALAKYIRRDYDGLREKIVLLMDGARLPVNLRTYQNDMTSFKGADDVLALLIHLGYLGWDSREDVAFVPNREVRQIFCDSTNEPSWESTFAAIEASKELVRATIAGEETRVAELLDKAYDCAGNKTYNSEAALSYAVRLAYYAAQKWYTEVVELDSGRGYADVAYLPSPRCPEKPALLVELKWMSDADTALSQIRDRRYHGRLEHYLENLLLVGISYDRDARPGSRGYKRHTCRIERA